MTDHIPLSAAETASDIEQYREFIRDLRNASCVKIETPNALDDVDVSCWPAVTVRDALDALRGVAGEASPGVASIAAERQRQMDVEGWTPEHDDTHDRDELSAATAPHAANDRRDWRWT